MAKSFASIKLPTVDLLDQITVGKLKGCRFIDVVEDHWEYLIWLEKTGYIKYAQASKSKLMGYFLQHEEDEHYKNEIEPYINDDPFEDVPY